MYQKYLKKTVLVFLIILMALNIQLVYAQDPSLGGGQCYVIADDGDIFGKVNTNGSVTWVGPLPAGYRNGENLAIDPYTGLVYNIAGEESETPLIIIDPETLDITEINPNTSLWDVDALAFNPEDGVLYAVNKYEKFNNEPGILQLVDKNTGVATKIVDLYFDGAAPTPTGVDPHIDGVAFDPEDGTLYGVYGGWGGPSYLVFIDMGTGLITVVGDTGVEDIEDISFRWDGVLIGALGDQGRVNGTDFEGLVVIDKDTSNASKLGVGYDDPQTRRDVEAFACMIQKTGNGVRVGGELTPIDSIAVKASKLVVYLVVLLVATVFVKYGLHR